MRNRSTEKRWIRKTFETQGSEKYCGPACLASIVKYHGGAATQGQLIAPSGTALTGTTMLGMIAGAIAFGLHAEGYQANISALKELKAPVILLITNMHGLPHYVVCYGYSQRRFTIGDPATGVFQCSERELAAVWKSQALLTLEPTTQFSPADSPRRSPWFIDIIRANRTITCIVFAIGVVLAMLNVAVAIYFQRLLDIALPKKDLTQLMVSCTLLAAILLSKAVLDYVRGALLARQNMSINQTLTEHFLDRFIRLPKSFFDSITIGDVTTRFADAAKIQRSFNHISFSTAIDALIFMACSVYISFVSPAISLLVYVCVLIVVLIIVRNIKTLSRRQNHVFEQYAAAESKCIETFRGIATIKSFNKEQLFRDLNLQLSASLFEAGKNLENAMNKVRFYLQLVYAMFMGLTVAASTYLFLENQFLFGEFAAILILCNTLVNSVVSASFSIVQFREADIAHARLQDFASIAGEDFEGAEGFTISSLNTIEAANISFRFPGKRLLFQNLNFHLRKGQITVFTGDIGSGKSTLFMILNKFYTISNGRILANNVPWDDIPVNYWRSFTGYVAQHDVLFTGTVAENICLDHPTAENMAAVQNFCETYGFDRLLTKLPNGYLTVIQEGSVNLSGGQRQLIAIARALYKRPKVLLLDEATSAMDYDSEKFVMSLLHTLKTQMITALISHKVQVALQCDYAYIMGANTIESHGSPSGVFKKIS